MDNTCGGWICFHRKSIHSAIFKNEGIFKLWMWCLAKANHEKGWVKISTGRGHSMVEINPGQFVYGRKSASKELDMDESTVYKRMQFLKKHQNVTIESNTKYSIISIVNWNTYQNVFKNSNIESNKQVISKYEASNTNNNDNNDNKEKILSSEKQDDAIRPLENGKIPFKDIVSIFHEVLPEFPPIIKLTDARKAALRGRWNTESKTKSLDWWREYFEWVRDSDFLMGRTKKPFACCFDWIIKSQNFIKIREGNYHK